MNLLTNHSLQIFFYAILTLGLGTFTTSCSKDEQAVTPSTLPSCLLTGINYGEESQGIEYDSKNRVNKVTFEEGHAMLEYNSNNQVVKLLSYDLDKALEETMAIEYNAKGQWTKITFTDAGSTSSDVTTAEYDSNGNRTKITSNNNVITYEYTDRNLVRSSINYGSNTYTTRYEYYTDKENKLTMIEELFNTGYGPTPSKNMLKKQTYDSFDSGENFTYEFNEKGFPIKRTSTSIGDSNGDGVVDANDADVDVTTYSYQCK